MICAKTNKKDEIRLWIHVSYHIWCHHITSHSEFYQRQRATDWICLLKSSTFPCNVFSFASSSVVFLTACTRLGNERATLVFRTEHFSRVFRSKFSTSDELKQSTLGFTLVFFLQLFLSRLSPNPVNFGMKSVFEKLNQKMSSIPLKVWDHSVFFFSYLVRETGPVQCPSSKKHWFRQRILFSPFVKFSLKTLGPSFRLFAFGTASWEFSFRFAFFAISFGLIPEFSLQSEFFRKDSNLVVDSGHVSCGFCGLLHSRLAPQLALRCNNPHRALVSPKREFFWWEVSSKCLLNARNGN